MLIAGIDPGFGGAIAIIDTDKHALIDTVYDMPTFKNEKSQLDCRRIVQILSAVDIVYIEEAQPMSKGGVKQGVSSTGRYMKGAGIIEGICYGLGKAIELVKPMSWKKMLMEGMPKEKEASMIKASQLYPHIELKRKKDHGRADAILIATYGLKHQFIRSNHL